MMIVSVGIAVETDTAFVVDHFFTVQVGIASETDTAFTTTPNPIRRVGLMKGELFVPGAQEGHVPFFD